MTVKEFKKESLISNSDAGRLHQRYKFRKNYFEIFFREGVW